MRTRVGCVWVSGAAVVHWIPKSRVTLHRVQQYWRNVGVQHVRLNPADADASMLAHLKSLRRDLIFRLATLGKVNERSSFDVVPTLIDLAGQSQQAAKLSGQSLLRSRQTQETPSAA